MKNNGRITTVNSPAKKDCRHYRSGTQKSGGAAEGKEWERCAALKELYCARGGCNWYKPKQEIDGE